MTSIPTWTVKLSYDYRQLLAWGLRKFVPAERDGIADLLKSAIAEKASEIVVDAMQLDYLHRLGCGADASGDAVRVDAGRFLAELPDPRLNKPTGVRTAPKSTEKQQKMMF